MFPALKFDPAADLAAKFIEQIELDALALHVDTRTLGVGVAKHLSTWFEAFVEASPRKIQRLAPQTRRRGRSVGTLHG